MGKELWRVVRTVLGVVLVIVGIIGLFLPLLQGIVIIIIGMHFVAPEKGERIVKRGVELFNEKFRKRKSG